MKRKFLLLCPIRMITIRMMGIILMSILLTACVGNGANGGATNGAASLTPIPTIRAAVMPTQTNYGKLAALNPDTSCSVYAVELIGAWVKAGAPESKAFDFKDINNQSCSGTFPDDVHFLFNQSNVWFPGALACSNCHTPDIKVAWAGMNLSDYQGIMMGERRSSDTSKGSDILANGDWEKSKLYQVLATKYMPLGRPASLSEKGPLVLAGKPK
jgi:hypothetical protein